MIFLSNNELDAQLQITMNAHVQLFQIRIYYMFSYKSSQKTCVIIHQNVYMSYSSHNEKGLIN